MRLMLAFGAQFLARVAQMLQDWPREPGQYPNFGSFRNNLQKARGRKTRRGGHRTALALALEGAEPTANSPPWACSD